MLRTGRRSLEHRGRIPQHIPVLFRQRAHPLIIPRRLASLRRRRIAPTSGGFTYAKAKPNRFANKAPKGSLAVLLDPDHARVFQSAESVNTALRAVITTMRRRTAHTG